MLLFYDSIWDAITGDNMKAREFIKIANNTESVKLFLSKYDAVDIESQPYVMGFVAYSVHGNNSSYTLMVSLNSFKEVTGYSLTCITPDLHYNAQGGAVIAEIISGSCDIENTK